MIPRKRGRKGILSANAAAMAGMVWVTGEEEVKQWLEQGPMKLLCEFGVVDEASVATTQSIGSHMMLMGQKEAPPSDLQ